MVCGEVGEVWSLYITMLRGYFVRMMVEIPIIPQSVPK